MLKNMFIVGALVVLMSVGLAGVATAGEGDYLDIIGTDELVLATPSAETDRVAKEYTYDHGAQSRVGTEAGMEFLLIPSEQKASKNVAGTADTMDTRCGNC